jgi:glycosyltransferase involved in cell wall biosynthesis
VVPSIWPEPRSRVVLEAMHFGRAVVATAVGGTPELIEAEVSGLLVRPADPIALGDAIAALLRDPARRRALGAAAAARATRAFDADAITARLLDIYREVVDRSS